MLKYQYPDAPCMEYLPTFTLKVSKNDPNVGKYSTHGASGIGFKGGSSTGKKCAKT